MLLDFNAKIKLVDGTETEDLLKTLAANILSNKATGIEVLKAWDWATEISKNGIINIDRTDADLLEKCIKTAKDEGILTVLGAAQLLLVISNAKIVEAAK